MTATNLITKVKFKYIDIKDLVNNIRNNTISKISAKEGLNKIKNTEIIKYKKHTPTQKELLNLFNDLLDTILTDKTLISLNENVSDNVNENVNEKGNENINEKKNENVNEKENENVNEKENENVNENENEEENENDKTLIIKQLNDCLDEIIGKSKSFENQIESIKKAKDLNEYYYINDYGDKESEFKIFKLKLAVKYH